MDGMFVGVDVDFYNVDICVEGVGYIGWVIVVDGFQVGFQFWDCLVIGGKGDFFYCFELFWCVFDGKLVDILFYVVVMYFKQVSCDYLCFGVDFVGGYGCCSVGDRC